MKITLDIPETELKDILRYSGEDEEGPAVAKLLTAQLKLQRRRELSEKSLTDKIRVPLPEWPQSRTPARESTQCVI